MRATWSMLLLSSAVVFSGCGQKAEWPPVPRNEQEKQMVRAALRAVEQFDGWDEVACVVERRRGGWRVQAWRVVYPNAKGRSRCVPWAVRGITLDDDAKVLSYENTL